jgi:hypothetical protein
MRLSLSVGRLDFWNLNTGKKTDELTPYEELIWRVYEIVEPFGEKRADMRTAQQTAELAAQRGAKQEALQGIYERGVGYLGLDEHAPKTVTGDEAAVMMGAK